MGWVIFLIVSAASRSSWLFVIWFLFERKDILDNGKSLILRINDRGPYIEGRMLDCSYGAAKKLDFIKQGTAKVQVDIIEWGDGKYMHHRERPKWLRFY